MMNAAEYIKENIVVDELYEIRTAGGNSAWARIFSSDNTFYSNLFQDLINLGVRFGVGMMSDKPYVLCELKEPDTTTTGASA